MTSLRTNDGPFGTCPANWQSHHHARVINYSLACSGPYTEVTSQILAEAASLLELQRRGEAELICTELLGEILVAFAICVAWRKAG